MYNSACIIFSAATQAGVAAAAATEEVEDIFRSVTNPFVVWVYFYFVYYTFCNCGLHYTVENGLFSKLSWRKLLQQLSVTYNA